MQSLGELLREYREDAGMTLEELGVIADLSHVAIGDWERGKRNPRRSNLLAVIRALNLSASKKNAVLAAAGFATGDEIIRELDPDSVITFERYSGLGKPDQKIIDQMVEALFERKLQRTDDEE
jgi:transcriptional regulator with XRE-family HTH domain